MHLIDRFLFIVALLFSTECQSCECLWHGSFSEAVRKADLIVSGSVLSGKGNAIDFHIEKIILDTERHGKEFNETIRVWGDNGQLCRPDTALFPINTQWIFALMKITNESASGFNPNTPNISYGRINDYYLSKCGAYWLKLHDGYATGNIVNGPRWEWENKKINPVREELIDAYINNIIPKQALIEASKPLTETKKLMEKTKNFIRSQE
jgi:hypothetical protein